LSSSTEDAICEISAAYCRAFDTSRVAHATRLSADDAVLATDRGEAGRSMSVEHMMGSLPEPPCASLKTTNDHCAA
jgi:hypothetical protein